MATLTSTQITEDGIAVSGTTLDASNTFTNTGKEFIYFANDSGVTKTITVTAQTTSVDDPLYGELTKANATLAVANGATALIGPFAVEAYNDTNQETTFAITPYDAADRDSAQILYV
tara:strand:+ start:2864 stop:3214 length:351 start_codon:yes stop_codon:yes gene_type:complete